jgi:hypothetical protein
MKVFKSALTAVATFVLGAYLLSVTLMTSYYNWQYARDNGFIAWLLLGQIVPTSKALVWPYFVFLRGARGERVERDQHRAVTIAEYTANKYSYVFQFPSDWKVQKPPGGEAGGIRVLVQGPSKGSYVMALVGTIDKVITKQQYDKSPNRDATVNALIEWTVENSYKKTSRDIGATSMLVTEKRALTSEVGIKFYIATANTVGRTVVAVAGIHVVPFGKDYVVAFLMIHPLDPKATAENEMMDRVFNSFHIVGERPT